MAAITTYSDDFDGSTGADVQPTRVRITRGGKVVGTWVGDFSDANFEALVTKGLTKFRRAASEVTGDARNSDAEDVRTWARANGHTVADQGRIPAKVQEAYDAAMAAESIEESTDA